MSPASVAWVRLRSSATSEYSPATTETNTASSMAAIWSATSSTGPRTVTATCA